MRCTQLKCDKIISEISIIFLVLFMCFCKLVHLFTEMQSNALQMFLNWCLGCGGV